MAAPIITKDIQNRSLTIIKDFEAPLPKVWSAWTTAEKLTRWWGPQDWPTTSHSFDFREGGRWHYSMTGPDGTTHFGLLKYLRIQPMKTLDAEDFFADAHGKPNTEMPLSRWEVRFRKTGSGTTVVTKLNFTTQQDLERTIAMGFQEGYTSALDNLTQLLGRAEPQTVVSKDGTKIVYEKVGSGSPVILVGGAMVTRTNQEHVDLAGALSHKHTVYNYDRRGRGDSGDTAPWAIEREIEDLAALLEVAGGKAAVYGLSSGAILSLKAVGAGLPVTKLVLYEPPFIVDPSDRRPPADSIAAVTKLVAAGKRAAAVDYFMTKIFGMPAFVPWMIRLTPYWKPTVAVANTLPYDLTITGDYSIPPVAAGVKIPTLVVYGDQTQPLLKHGAHGVAKAIPGAVLKELPGVNHQIAVKDLAPAVLAFL